MLVYNKGYWGVPLLLRGFPRGTPVTRALLYPLLSVIQTLCIFQARACASVRSALRVR
jgi:hypothetical protein